MNLKENLRIDINAASAEELCRLPGIHLALAQRIVAYRQERGTFQAEEELRAVEGIEPSLYAGLEAYVVVGDSGTKEAAAAVPTEGKPLEKIRFQTGRMRPWLAYSPFFRTRRRAMVSALAILPILLCLGYWLLGSIVFAHTATLTDLSGASCQTGADTAGYRVHLGRRVARSQPVSQHLGGLCDGEFPGSHW